MSASGGKADIPDTPHQCPLMTHSRHRRLEALASLPVQVESGVMSFGSWRGWGDPDSKLRWLIGHLD